MSRSSRALRLGVVSLLALAGLTCRDRSLTGPALPGKASLALVPSLSIGEGAPVIRLAKARALLLRLPGREVALDTVAVFPTSGDLSLDLAVPMLAPTESFELRIRGIDAKGDTVYSATSEVSLAQNAQAPTPVPVALTYSGPDTLVASIAVAPRDTSFRSGDAFRMRFVARRTSGDPVPNVLVGWISRNPAVIAVDAATGDVTAKAAKGSAWLVGVTANDRRDSTQVFAVAPVAKVDLDAVGEITVTRGATRLVAAVTRDADGALLTGRTVTWSSTNPAAATVDASGLVAALRADSTTTIVATAEGKSASVVVRVGRKQNRSIQLSRATDTLVVGAARVLTAAAFDSANAVNTDEPVVWTSLDPTVATVNPGTTFGLATVTAVKEGGPVVIRASAGGASADYVLRVVPVPTRAVALTPRTAGAAAEDSLTLEAVARDSAGGALAGRTIDFRVLDTAVANFRALDATHARVYGKVEGTARLVASREGVADTATITFGPARVASVELLPLARSVPLGDSALFTATAHSASGRSLPGRPVTFATIDPAVATVSAAGWVKGANPGATRVIATIEGVADTSDVTVTQVLAAITVVPGIVHLEPGATRTLELQGRDTRGNPMPVPGTPVWSVDDPRIATVDAGGVLRAVAPGTASVTATAGGFTSPAAYVSVGGLQMRLPDDTVRIATNTVFALPVRLSRASPVEVSLSVGIEGANGVPDPDSVLYAGDAATGDFSEYYQPFQPNETVRYVHLTARNAGVVKLVAYHRSLCYGDGEGSCGGDVRARAARTAYAARLGRTAETYADSDAVFDADTVVIRVEAAAARLDRAVEVLAGDSLPAQLQLQAAAPAGGLKVVFDYGTPNVARVLPDTVVVPAGQLAASVWVRGAGTGSTSITPRSATAGLTLAGGATSAVVRTRRLSVYIPDLGRRDTVVIGQGQTSTSLASIVPAGLTAPVTVALSLSDPSVAAVPATLTLTADQKGAPVRIDGTRAGSTWLRATAPGWAGDSVLVRVSGSRVTLAGDFIIPLDYVEYYESIGYRFGSASIGQRGRLGAELRDSVRGRGALLAPVTVRLTSSDTTILAIDASDVVIAAGAQTDTAETLGTTVRPKKGGMVWLRATSPGFLPDSVRVDVSDAGLYWRRSFTDTTSDGAARVALGLGYRLPQDLYVSGADPREQVAIGLTHRGTALTVPDSAFTTSSLSSFTTVRYLTAVAAGTDTVVARAVGLAPDTLVVVVGRPRVKLAFGRADTLDTRLTIGANDYLGARLVDSTRGSGAFQWGAATQTLFLTVRDSSVVAVDPLMLSTGYSSGGAQVRPLRVGATWIVNETPGWVRDSMRVTVVSGRLDAVVDEEYSSAAGRYVDGVVGTDMRWGTAAQVSAGTGASFPATVKAFSLDPAIAPDGQPVTLTSPYAAQFFAIAGLAPGVARFEVRDVTTREGGAAFAPDTVAMRVTRSFIGWYGYSAQRDLAPGDTVLGQSLAALDSAEVANRGARADKVTTRAVALRVTTTDSTVLRVVPSTDVVRGGEFVIPAGGKQTPAFQLVAVGPGTASVVATDTSASGTRFVTFTSEPIRVWSNRAVAFDQKVLALGYRQRLAYGLRVCRARESGSDSLDVTLTTTGAAVARGVEGRTLADTAFRIGASATSAASCVGVNVLSGTASGTVAVVATARRGASVVSQDTLRVQVAPTALVVGRNAAFGDSTEVYVPDSIATAYATLDEGGRVVSLDRLDVTLATSDASVLALGATTVTIAAGATRSDLVRITPGTAGVARLTARLTSGTALLPGALTVPVVAPRLRYASPSLARGFVGVTTRVSARAVYGSRGGYLRAVNFAALDPAIADLPGATADSSSSSLVGVPLRFKAAGKARVVASAPGFRPETLTVVVDSVGALEYAYPAPDTVSSAYTSQVRWRLTDTSSTYRGDLAASDSIVFDVTFDTPGVLELRNVDGAPVTKVVIPAGTAESHDYYFHGVNPGTARIRLTNPRFVPKQSDRIVVVSSGGG